MTGGSMRSRLVLLLSGACALLFGGAIALSYRDARRALDELFDAQLAESARVLLTQAEHAVHDAAEDGEARAASHEGEEHGGRLHLQLWDREGRLLYRSSADLPAEPVPSREGFEDRRLHGARWRVFTRSDPASGLTVQVCQRGESRRRLAAEMARHMLLPLVLALPLLSALIWLVAGRALRPLDDLARTLGARAPGELGPLETGPVPRELTTVTAAIDGLLARLRERLDLERRFTADAAHELRTPLAALKTQAQVAAGARDAAERERALAQVTRGVDRAARLVAQLLTLARLDHDLAAGEESVDLADVAREAARDAAGEGAPICVEAAPGAIVRGDRALLGTLCRNLVENAVRHGGGAARVAVARETGVAALRVADRGPGIPEEERSRVFDRFYRAPGSASAGSGLGLSIVKRIAELHGGTVSIGGGLDGRGLEVTVRIPSI